MNDWEFKIAKLDLQEGDVLVIKSDMEPRYEAIEAVIPSGVKVLFIPSDVELSVLTRAEIEEKAA